ncbi:replication protein A 70 kDa DNA-binding subunit B-like [Trifolium pratense]|uniref:replication protein A 70 kDa DNA-binding subunit B-like n=1 Tax=Trifolium pratense TaxID=57577 RepID=UPI001E690A19|nr:replication protein A 70 kDa DNA-binding subunit B-like [Trifolium pratense]
MACIEGKSSCDNILSVRSSKNDGIYEVRVLKRWRVPDFFKPEMFDSVAMVLIDKHGHKIEAVIPENLLCVFDEKIVEGRVYRISSLSVKLNFGHSVSTFHRYKFEFNKNTKVEPCSNCAVIPTYGLSLIGADDVLKKKEKKECYKYLVDVVGVITKVQHNKDFYPDGKVIRSVTFKLNNERKSFCCELYGSLVDDFKNLVKSCSNGLPIVVLQFVRINYVQGGTLVQGVENVTKIHVNPATDELLRFKSGLVLYLSRSANYGGLLRSSLEPRLSEMIDFLKDYPVKTIGELKSDPELGTFIVNARMLDIVKMDPWWYPICKCNKIFDKYIGAFHCTKCNAADFKAAPKVKLTVEVEDETGYALVTSFDHVMAKLAVYDTSAREINSDNFYRAFAAIMGKSIMWIVKKTFHGPDFVGCSFDLVRVSNHKAVIEYFRGKGLYTTPSKIVRRRLLSNVIAGELNELLPSTTTTSDLEDLYLSAAYPIGLDNDRASSSGSKRPRD